MNTIDKLLNNNQNWANQIKKYQPEFFNKLAKQQHPEILWIGCSDSRIPATQIVDSMPGDIFVHRNIANLVVQADINCHSVIQYAVEFLKVKHIIVCGHYGCGGIIAALDNKNPGMISKWLKHIQDVYNLHLDKFEGLSMQEKTDLLCELNVREQVKNVCKSNTITKAWESGQDLNVHGWIYNINDGLIKSLNICVTQPV